jgi:hypothetical protein
MLRLSDAPQDLKHALAPNNTATRAGAPPHVGPGQQAAHTDDVRRLLEQRASLLRAGVYTPDDPVIRAFDAEIQALMPVS